MDHREAAMRHVEAGTEGKDLDPALHLAAAGVHAVLHLAETLQHGLRDLVYELRS